MKKSIAPIVMALALSATANLAHADTYGYGDSYSYHARCEVSTMAVIVSSASYRPAIEEALLDKCAIVVTMYAAKHYLSWDFTDPELNSLMDIAFEIDLPLMLVVNNPQPEPTVLTETAYVPQVVTNTVYVDVPAQCPGNSDFGHSQGGKK